MAKGKKPTEANASDGTNQQIAPSNEKALVPVPVDGCSMGDGLPYAPENWPNPGDIWRWKVGNRKATSGHWVDRFLYAPKSFQQPAFSSKVSVEQYIKKQFPDTDVEKFFASFIWRIPAADYAPRKEGSSKRTNGCGDAGSESSGSEDCKAGNKMCYMRSKEKSDVFAAKACDICCSERNFCRDCCCILCCKTIDWAYEGYSCIRCEAYVDEKLICGHVAHLDCALRCYLAGTVRGSINLDVEYYCRRCDNKTDLMEHMTKLFKTCESVNSSEDAEKMLNLGLSILHDSKQIRAKNLQSCMELVVAKLKHGLPHEEIWKKDDNFSAFTSGGDISNNVNEITLLGALHIGRNRTQSVGSRKEIEASRGSATVDARAQTPIYITADHSNVSAKLDDDINKVLQELKKSQESEFRLAEQKLLTQKDLLLSLYQQLDVDRSKLATQFSSPNGNDSDALLTNVLARVDRIKYEELKLQDMMKIADGFGQTPKTILSIHFGMNVDE
ncbi:hypothetical protein J5N97_025604 [Dioscorea zingiberensis]|uniref:Oberon PHD finger domain-containing protein n=1 Tax=Dioscorea zingiberensis TaxID=325984 RepID=A0A9D5C117_9LILI|nr:hypothetical protein J5N97_025604 [Dioscorea zingiberensis]